MLTVRPTERPKTETNINNDITWITGGCGPIVEATILDTWDHACHAKNIRAGTNAIPTIKNGPLVFLLAFDPMGWSSSDTLDRETGPLCLEPIWLINGIEKFISTYTSLTHKSHTSSCRLWRSHIYKFALETYCFWSTAKFRPAIKIRIFFIYTFVEGPLNREQEFKSRRLVKEPGKIGLMGSFRGIYIQRWFTNTDTAFQKQFGFSNRQRRPEPY